MVVEYLRHIAVYFHATFFYGGSKSSGYRKIKWIEGHLIFKHRKIHSNSKTIADTGYKVGMQKPRSEPGLQRKLVFTVGN